uniref:Uncharacterized protein n=1 Tax=Anguilla anguilla TaxID=7936 RepID=A0A0E9T1D9_ANGAN
MHYSDDFIGIYLHIYLCVDHKGFQYFNRDTICPS